MNALNSAVRCHEPPAQQDCRAVIEIEAPEQEASSTLVASYIERCEEWKCSYRLEIDTPEDEGMVIVDDDSAPASEGFAVLHLLGRVRNTTEENWCGARLSLVANELVMLTPPTVVEKEAPSSR